MMLADFGTWVLMVHNKVPAVDLVEPAGRLGLAVDGLKLLVDGLAVFGDQLGDKCC